MQNRLLSFSNLGENRNAPRFWIEGARLASLGFAPGASIACEVLPRGLTITTRAGADRVVSSKRAAGGAWWEHAAGEGRLGPGDDIIITRDITIRIIVSSPNKQITQPGN